MAHRGRFYEYALHRDWCVEREYPNLYPRKFTFWNFYGTGDWPLWLYLAADIDSDPVYNTGQPGEQQWFWYIDIGGGNAAYIALTIAWIESEGRTSYVIECGDTLNSGFFQIAFKGQALKFGYVPDLTVYSDYVDFLGVTFHDGYPPFSYGSTVRLEFAIRDYQGDVWA
jgi:hypothetical protein